MHYVGSNQREKVSDIASTWFGCYVLVRFGHIDGPTHCMQFIFYLAIALPAMWGYYACNSQIESRNRTKFLVRFLCQTAGTDALLCAESNQSEERER